ncbi:MAG: hypothetical protein FWG17_05660 [Desulfovibrionaceae bacterium]|nr:hypothetical protein [Desulfovibrionaceae bacterium]
MLSDSIMLNLERFKSFCRSKKRQFTVKRGRMGRSVFFENLCLAALFCLLYALGLRRLIFQLHDLALPRIIYSNIYFIGAGILFLVLAFGTRPLRLKRLRDIGLPAKLDWPFFLLLIGHGLGPIFHVLGIPYLSSVEVISMPPEVRDWFGIIWLIWLLVLILAPAKRQQDLFSGT